MITLSESLELYLTDVRKISLHVSMVTGAEGEQFGNGNMFSCNGQTAFIIIFVLAQEVSLKPCLSEIILFRNPGYESSINVSEVAEVRGKCLINFARSSCVSEGKNMQIKASRANSVVQLTTE
jgi:hypothetical protein